MRKQSLAFLKELLSTPSPSGHEAAAQKIWCEYARTVADEVKTDAYGNAVAIHNPGGSPRIMLDGHIDEIGMVVNYIDDKGFVYIQRIGGVDPGLVRGKRVRIHGAKGKVLGVIGSTPIHLQDRTRDAKAPKLHEVYVDIGASSKKEAEKRVALGDPMTFTDGFEMLTEHIAVARGMDNRTGTWVVLEALRLAAKKHPECAIYACSAVQEEVGCIGARMLAHSVKPDAAIAVDVTFATDTPGIDNKQHGKVELGKGPSICLGRENHPVLTQRLRNVAKDADLPYQIETFHVLGGTDAHVIHIANGGIPTALVSIPNRYMHSTIETIDLRDLENTVKLLAAFMLDLKKDEAFKVQV